MKLVIFAQSVLKVLWRKSVDATLAPTVMLNLNVDY